MKANYFCRLAIFFTVLFISLEGCSHSPLDPATSPQPESISVNFQSAPNHNLMGYGTILIDAVSGDTEIVQLRSADSHLNVTGILNATMGTGVALVPGESDPPNGLFAIDVTLTHPLANPKFSGFDVKGILMTASGIPIGPLWFAAQDDVRLNNPDGFTRWWNPSEFTDPGMFGYTKGNFATEFDFNLDATINPYKYFADVLTPTSTMSAVQNLPLDDGQGRGIFSAGASNTRRYEIRFPLNPGPVVKFGYAVDASWAPPAVNPPGEVPDDFPIEANQPEAYNLPIAAKVNTLFYDSETGLGGGFLKFQVNVHDWQGQMAGDISGQVDIVRLFGQAIWNGGITATLIDETPTKAIYEATVESPSLTNMTSTGERLVAVRAGSAGGPNYQQGFGAAPDSNISAWNAIWVDIVDPDCSVDSNNSFGEAGLLDVNDSIQSQICGSADPEDYYQIEVPPGYGLTGNVTFYCDAELSKLGLYDSGLSLISQEAASAGKATLSYENNISSPGTYYLKLETASSDQAALYYLESIGDLVDHVPANPVDITPQGLDLDPALIDVHGDYVYLYGVKKLWIYDQSGSEPEFLSSVPVGVFTLPSMAYPYLYCMNNDGMGTIWVDVVDVSDPADPIVYNEILTYGNAASGLIEYDGYLYVSAYNGIDWFIKIYDVTTPSIPVFVDDFVIGNWYARMSVTEANSEVYLAALTLDSVEIHVITDPTAVTFDSSFSPPDVDGMRELAADGQYLYFLYKDTFDDYYMNVRSKPGASGTTDLATVSTMILPTAMDIDGDILAIVYFTGDHELWDITTPSSPSAIVAYGSYYGSWLFDVEVVGNDLYVPESEVGYVKYDITNPLVFNVMATVTGLAVPSIATYDESTDMLYVAENGSPFRGVKSVSGASTPENMKNVNADNTGAVVRSIDARNGILAVGRDDMGWVLYDVSDPNYMTYISFYAMTGVPYAAAVTDTHVFLGTDDPAFEVYELAAGPAASYLINFATSTMPLGFAFKDNYLYYHDGTDIYVYDITNPGAPVSVTTYSPAGPVSEIEVIGDYMYAAYDEGVEIIDISSPDTPVQAGSQAVAGGSTEFNLALDDVIGYVADMSGPDIPEAVKLYPPDNPDYIGDIYSTPLDEEIRDLLVINGNLFEFYRPDGLRVWDLY